MHAHIANITPKPTMLILDWCCSTHTPLGYFRPVTTSKNTRPTLNKIISIIKFHASHFMTAHAPFRISSTTSVSMIITIFQGQSYSGKGGAKWPVTCENYNHLSPSRPFPAFDPEWATLLCDVVIGKPTFWTNSLCANLHKTITSNFFLEGIPVPSGLATWAFNKHRNN